MGSGERRHDIDLLVSDVDGTLARTDKRIGQRTVDAVARLRDSGVRFTIISARPARGMRYPIEALGVDEPVAAFNGGTIMNPDGGILSAHRLERSAALDVLALLRAQPTELWVFADDLWLTGEPDGPHAPRERRAIAVEPTVRTDFELYADRIDKIVAASDDHALLERLEDRIHATLGGAVHASRSQPYYLDVTGPDADKGHGLEELARAMGVPLERVAVIGDGHNDIPMFEKAGLAIAMGQAADQVKQAAAMVAADNDADGVADAIDRFILRKG